MKRKSGGRTYLQQLAQPVPSGATVLTARPVDAVYANDPAPQVPIIEDRFNFPDNALTAATRNPTGSLLDGTHSSIALPPDPGDVNANSSASKSSRAVARHSDLSHPSAEPGTVIRSVQATEARSASASSPRVHSVPDEQSVEQPMRAETPRVVPTNGDSVRSNSTQSLQSEVRPVEKHTAQRIKAPAKLDAAEAPAAFSKTSKEEPSSRFAAKDDTSKRKDIQQPSDPLAPVSVPAPPQQKSEVRHAEGPRVHIGTLEIRAVLPQPVAPQPATMTQNVAQNNAVAQARGRSGVAEPLARGLDWSYGLVQG